MRIIVEAGCNWSNLDEAKLFIKKSKELGLFATKFQIYDDSMIKESEHYDFLKSIQLDYKSAKELFDYGKSMEQEVFFSCMFLEAVDWCEEIGTMWNKIRFKDQGNLFLINKIMKTKRQKYCFISTDFPNVFIKLGFKPLYCIPKYPALYLDYSGIDWNRFQGVSDHTGGILLLETLKDKDIYFEKHVKLNDDCIESAWSVTFEQLAEVLK